MSKLGIYIATIVIGLWIISANAAPGVKGWNAPGSDYDNFNAASPLICHNSCGGDPRCSAWTWVKPGIQGKAGHCWLKHAEPNLVQDSCCTSGARAGMIQSDLRAEDQTDRPDLDYRSFVENSWQNCQQACLGDHRCSSWSYRRKSVAPPNGACWLKSGVARPLANPGFISGVKYRPRNL